MPQAAGLVLARRSPPAAAASSAIHMSRPRTPTRAELFTLHRMICEACLTDWIHLAVLVD